MKFKEEIETVIEQLKLFGFNRRSIEQALVYSEGSIDQTLSRGGNAKMLAALKMLLELETLRKSILRENRVDQKEDTGSGEAMQLLRNISSNLIETRHTVELNQVLVKTTLNQSARLETLMTKAPLQTVLQRLNAASEEIFLKIHPELDPTNAR